MKQITFEELVAEFDESVRDRIRGNWAQIHVDGMVVFENQQLDSSQVGQKTALIFGPGCTYTTLDAIRGGRLGDLPSNFQYPVRYALKGPSGESTQATGSAASG